jgi:death-on-curing family protein
MKKLCFYLTRNNYRDDAIEIFNSKLNSSSLIFDVETKSLVQISSYEVEEVIEKSSKFLELDEHTIRLLISMIEPSLDDCRKIAYKNMGIFESNNRSRLEAMIESKINKYFYNGKDILSLCSEIFIGILMGHYLSNGNKRFAFAFLRRILFELGYFFKWSNNRDSKLNNIEELVIMLQRNHNTNSETADMNVFEVKKWIYERISVICETLSDRDKPTTNEDHRIINYNKYHDKAQEILCNGIINDDFMNEMIRLSLT